ncbi:MAG: hypothetical protein HYR49_01640 [Gammaproteobacteria bacterium]|nr:hypothetical protein [Gammaproteobacteria bacterium]
MTDTPGMEPTEREQARVVQDLQRRIDALHHAHASDFGAFTILDWLLCVGGFVVFPYLLFLWFWP